MAGLAWATVCVPGIEANRYFRSRNPEVILHEEELERGTRPGRDAMESRRRTLAPPQSEHPAP